MAIVQPRIYLASQSPRRRELLRQIGVSFELLLLRADPRRQVDVDETPQVGEKPEAYALRVCGDKARAGVDALKFRNLPPFPVLAADTAIALGDEIFGKPGSAAHAAEMLRRLSGCEHRVLSAVAVARDGRVETALSLSTVRFTPLDEHRIQQYLLTREYMGKAGGYAIQGLAGAFVEHISGSYSGVMGLPLFETVQLLRRFNYPTP
jgi:septum formation protein